MIKNILSISGGKDSTAMLLLAIEQQTENLQAVFCDTGHEHQKTYDYVDYLERSTGIEITWVKADFSEKILKRRKHIAEKWPDELTKETPGKWVWNSSKKRPEDIEPPKLIVGPDRFVTNQTVGPWLWISAREAMTRDQAAEVVERALDVLQPTGNPFLDLCLWKGRFPSSRRRFCTQFLKLEPVQTYIAGQMDGADAVISWQGIRNDESAARSHLGMYDVEFGSWEPEPTGHLIYRPIHAWTAEEVFAQHKRHGIQWNPLYEQGMGRVGCMPCINARKGELNEIAQRFPEEIARVAKWERLVAAVSKRGISTMFASTTIPYASERDNKNVSLEKHGIHAICGWAKTSRGGRQIDFINVLPSSTCTSIYGLCE